ncbi:hypothetical protein MMC22_003065 [Lobaria immixta]|nr:hypothetical protein [Lobaria immixta]
MSLRSARTTAYALQTYLNTCHITDLLTLGHTIRKQTTAEHTSNKISFSIQFFWEHQKQLSILKPVNKPKATRLAFAAQATQGATLNGEEAPDALATPESAKTAAEAAKQPKQPNKRKQRKGQNPQRGCRTKSTRKEPSQQPNRSRSPKANQAKSDQNRDRGPCAACGGTTHTFSRCFLVLGQERDWLTDEARDTFKNNIKAASFKKWVDNYQKALQTVQSLADK